MRRAIPVRMLGQAGVRLEFSDCIVYVDPYLTDSVAESFGAELRRMIPAPMAPEDVADADWVLVTHEHLDHLDPESLRGISRASPACRFVAPAHCHTALQAVGIDASRIVTATEEWTQLGPSSSVMAVPAAHPVIERDPAGLLLRVGYLIRAEGVTVLHTGDTSANDTIASAVRSAASVDFAFVPVNERNHYRDRAGILGNMTVREALRFAEEAGASALIPIHWDLFRPNSVSVDEIRLVHETERCPLTLLIAPATLAH
jgi:L-ascorbate 6-phosphate lactonase